MRTKNKTCSSWKNGRVTSRKQKAHGVQQSDYGNVQKNVNSFSPSHNYFHNDERKSICLMVYFLLCLFSLQPKNHLLRNFPLTLPLTSYNTAIFIIIMITKHIYLFCETSSHSDIKFYIFPSGVRSEGEFYRLQDDIKININVMFWKMVEEIC